MTLYPKLILDALATVTYPGTKKNLVDSEMVADNLRIDGMNVSFSLIFPRDTDPFMKSTLKAAEAAIHYRVSKDVRVTIDTEFKSAKRPEVGKLLPNVKNVIAVSSGKGGVGKTTTAVNLAACTAQEGKRVLLVDIDPQGNATSGAGVDKNEGEYSVYDVIINELEAKKAIQHTKIETLDVLPSRIELAGAEVELVSMMARERKLRTALKPLVSEYDYIFIDCPPSLGLLTLNALTAAQTLLVPIQCEYYALEGLAQLMATVRQIKRLYNPQLELEGVLLTMYDGRLNLTNQVVDEVKKFFPKKVYSSTIPRNVRLSEAPSYGEPIMYYDKTSKGAIAYAALAEEFLKKQ
jgi:chromosome partitioning protein